MSLVALKCSAFQTLFETFLGDVSAVATPTQSNFTLQIDSLGWSLAWAYLALHTAARSGALYQFVAQFTKSSMVHEEFNTPETEVGRAFFTGLPAILFGVARTADNRNRGLDSLERMPFEAGILLLQCEFGIDLLLFGCETLWELARADFTDSKVAHWIVVDADLCESGCEAAQIADVMNTDLLEKSEWVVDWTAVLREWRLAALDAESLVADKTLRSDHLLFLAMGTDCLDHLGLGPHEETKFMVLRA